MTIFYANDAPRPQTRPAAAAERRGRPRPARRGLWVAVACAMLAASGSVRAWQDRRFEAARDRVVTPLFRLADLPTRLGKWHARAGAETALDPQIAQISGAVDSLIRTYVDDGTGVAVTVLVLYGRAEVAALHVPEVCYPAAGYKPADDTFDIPFEAGPPASRFRSLVFAKEGGAGTVREEVYYAFRHNGRWAPELEGNWRALRYSPAVFKIQTRRLLADREHRQRENPTEEFLAVLVKEMEARVAAAAAGPARPRP